MSRAAPYFYFQGRNCRVLALIFVICDNVNHLLLFLETHFFYNQYAFGNYSGLQDAPIIVSFFSNLFKKKIQKSIAPVDSTFAMNYTTLKTWHLET